MPQSSENDRTFRASGPLTTDTKKCGVGGRSWILVEECGVMNGVLPGWVEAGLCGA
jgi:hypothetical protein